MLEKLLPGEAAESLIRLAIDAKSITGVHRFSQMFGTQLQEAHDFSERAASSSASAEIFSELMRSRGSLRVRAGRVLCSSDVKVDCQASWGWGT